MAKLLQAIQAYGPKLELLDVVRLKEVAKWMSMRTGLNKSKVMMVLQEQNEVILYFNGLGRPVKLPGIGIFRPSIDRNGLYGVNLRPDMELKRVINGSDAYASRINNKGNIGLDNDGYKALWDTDHPEDLLEIED